MVRITNENPLRRYFQRDSITGITGHQLAAVRSALSGRLGLLTGGPGTGKTHTSAVIVKEAIRLGLSVGAVAPTGKAAVRITEAMLERDIYLQACTIHTALQPVYTGYDNKGWAFRHCESNPLPFDFLLCDETSMVPLELMSDALGAVPTGSQVLLVGDPHQLPPVGSGKPFCDLINAGIPHGHLSEIWRFAGRIAHVCKQIRDGGRWEPSEKVDLEAKSPENMRHIECHSTQVIQTLLGLIPKLKNYGFNSPDQIQVICPCNSSGSLSRENLNKALQHHWNSGGQLVEGNKFRVGDKVMITKNQFYPAGSFAHYNTDSEYYVANGEIGKVVMNHENWTEANFQGRIIKIVNKSDQPLVSAFAITGHKSQGSQWPCVITIADGSGAADRVCSRAWWYTTISRAASLSVTIGQRAAIDKQCSNVALEHRKTFLTERVQEWLQEQSSKSALSVL